MRHDIILLLLLTTAVISRNGQAGNESGKIPISMVTNAVHGDNNLAIYQEMECLDNYLCMRRVLHQFANNNNRQNITIDNLPINVHGRRCAGQMGNSVVWLPHTMSSSRFSCLLAWGLGGHSTSRHEASREGVVTGMSASLFINPPFSSSDANFSQFFTCKQRI